MLPFVEAEAVDEETLKSQVDRSQKHFRGPKPNGEKRAERNPDQVGARSLSNYSRIRVSRKNSTMRALRSTGPE